MPKGHVKRKTTKATTPTKGLPRAKAGRVDGALSLDRALRYRWRDPEYGFADASERDPRRSAVGVLISDTPLCGGLTTMYWFTTLEQLAAWCARVVGPSEGVETETDDDGEELTIEQQEAQTIRRLIKAMGPRRRLAPVTDWLDEHMGASGVPWAGTFQELCSRPSGEELRQSFWAAQDDGRPATGAAIPRAQQARFIQWLQELNA